MGRYRPTKVASAPRGLGLYRRAGRDGFFFIKNLAAQAKRFPGKIKPGYVDEWIKRMDGTLITSQKEAETYCYRRNAQIQDMLQSLAGETVAYSGADHEAIAQQLATQWITARQRGINLQDLEAERWRLIARYGSKAISEWMVSTGSGGLLVQTDDLDHNGFPRQRSKPIAAEELEEEAHKLESL
jgi:hypothetical protein